MFLCLLYQPSIGRGLLLWCERVIRVAIAPSPSSKLCKASQQRSTVITDATKTLLATAHLQKHQQCADDPKDASWPAPCSSATADVHQVFLAVTSLPTFSLPTSPCWRLVCSNALPFIFWHIRWINQDHGATQLLSLINLWWLEC